MYPEWLKSKSYLHITPQVNLRKNGDKLIRIVTNTKYVSSHAFFPLIHTIQKVRRYKKDQITGKASHHRKSHGKTISNTKKRPLHYATHLDSIIFGYYAYMLQNLYEDKLKKNPILNSSISAYRRIPIDNDSKNKGTAHFAKEVFDEIRHRLDAGKETVALAFDIEKYFSSLDHKLLKIRCEELLQQKLPSDYKNVLKAATQFSYILKDDLRLKKYKNKRKNGFDEKKLAQIRKKTGANCFFESPKEFRDKIKSGELRIYKNHFKNAKGEMIGIPQGLPISAVLANLYLIEFDKQIVSELVEKRNCFFRRYSDDIIIICSKEDTEFVNEFVTTKITEQKVKISPEKTEKFLFRKVLDKTECFKLLKDNSIGKKGVLTYLGLEFNGTNTFIKSQSLAKFYRKMIYAVKTKAKRAQKSAEIYPWVTPAIYKRQLFKLYADIPLDKIKVHRTHKVISKNKFGEYVIKSYPKKNSPRSNYLNYVKRVSEIMNEEKIKKQLRNHYKLLYQAIHRQLNKIKK